MKASRFLLFIISLLIWFLLTWSLTPVNIAAGAVIALIVAFLEGGIFTKNPHKMLHMKRYGWFIVYVAILFWDIVKAGFEMLFQMFKPRLDLDPEVIKFNTELESGTGITALANTLTLIPGMTTVDVADNENALYVHLLNSAPNKELLTAKIKKYERILEKIFEEK